MAIEFEEGPKIDCANGDELYAVAIPFASRYVTGLQNGQVKS